MRNLTTWVLGLSMIVALGACSRQHAESADAATATEVAEAIAPAAPPMAQVSAPQAEDAPSGAAQMQSSAATYTDGERQFIRTANAQFRVKDVYRSALVIEDVVAAHGGFVVKNDINAEIDKTQSRPSGDGKVIELATYTVHGNLQVRVPSARTQAFLRAIVDQIEFLDRRNFQAADAQFELLRQQLAQSRHQAAQQALGEAVADGGKLGQKAEAIAARTDAQSSRDEARIAQKTFEDQVAFSTIDLSMYQPPRIRRSERIDVDAVLRSDGPGFFARAGHSLSVGWYGLLNLVLALIQVWPLWLILLAAGVLAMRLRKRRVPTA